ncbi:AAA family ATPase, partial [Leptospira interrogans serovar Pomona]
RYLPHRLIIVDEVSMVDLNLMLSLWNAIPRDTKKDDRKVPLRFILIGDPHQLPSVEKGAVLSDFLSVLESKKANFASRLEGSNRQKSKGNVSKIVVLAEEILGYSPENLNLGTKIDDSFPKTTTIGENSKYESEVVWLQNPANKTSDHLSRDEVVEKLWTEIFHPGISKIGTWKVK